jgi:hypothetical protein
MKSEVKSPILSLIILIILTVGLILRANWSRIQPAQSPLVTTIKNLRQENVNQILIEKGGQKFPLNKETDGWKLDSYLVNPQIVENLLTIIYNPNRTETVATTRDRHAEFELTDETAWKVSLNTNPAIRLGKKTLTGIYARIDSADTVYLLHGLAPELSEDKTAWLDKTIYSFDSDTLTRIRVVTAGTERHFVQKDKKWTDEASSKEMDQEKMDSLIIATNTLNAATVILEASGAAAYKGQPELTVTVEAGEGKGETVEFTKGESDYLVKRSRDNALFTMNTYSVENIAAALKNIQ